MARELHDAVVVAGEGLEELDRSVDVREPTVGRGEQDAVKLVHDVRDYGRVPCVST
jgi:hypothetical protein